MAKTLLSTTYLLIITAAVYLAALPPTKAQSSKPGPSRQAPRASISPAAASPQPDCVTYLANVSDCINFVEKGSDLRTPDPACCPELAGLINSHPVCLCEMLTNSSQFDMSSIDVNKALTLPSLCNINTSPNRLCPGLNNAGRTISLPLIQHFLVGVTLVLFTSTL